MAPLPHGANSVYVRQLQAFLNPREHVPDDIVDVWIWSFNLDLTRGKCRSRTSAGRTRSSPHRPG